jgi:leucyl aminopeptidase
MSTAIAIALKNTVISATTQSPCLVVPVFTGGAKSKLSAAAAQLDKMCAGQINTLLKRGDIRAAVGSSVLLPAVDQLKAERVLLVAAGDGKELSEPDYNALLDQVLKQLDTQSIATAHLLIDELSVIGRDRAWMVRQLAISAGLLTYRYSHTLSKPKAASKLKKLTLNITPTQALRTAANQGEAIAQGMNVARDLGDLPGNICTPSYLASQSKALAGKYKTLTTSVVEEKKMRELGMHSLLSVTAGTDQPAKLIIINYQGASKTAKPHALVGKGITFDTGGISLKPGGAMDEMKYDMCGAASVIGTMRAIAELNLPINVVAVIAAAENMPSSNATKPGDVVTSMSGQTIEILNTDAEGRLVLCDALTYTERFKPQSVIDVATLTGACVVALGKHASALYSNSDDFAETLLECGKAVGDRAWHMPLWDDYQSQLHSNFADMANIGGAGGGSITAACFLSRFAKNMRWAHLDIAGTAWLGGASKGATGRPVGLLTNYLIGQSEKK